MPLAHARLTVVKAHVASMERPTRPVGATSTIIVGLAELSTSHLGYCAEMVCFDSPFSWRGFRCSWGHRLHRTTGGAISPTGTIAAGDLHSRWVSRSASCNASAAVKPLRMRVDIFPLVRVSFLSIHAMLP